MNCDRTAAISRRRRPRRRRDVAALERLEHLPQHEPGVAHAAEADPVAAADVAGVVHDLAERRRRRQGRDVERAGEARADAEDDVGPLEEPVDGGRARAGGGAERERMALGEGALAVQGGRDRDAGALGQLHELLARAGVEHALPGQDHRVGRLGQDPHRLGDVRRSGLRAPRGRGADIPAGVAGRRRSGRRLRRPPAPARPSRSAGRAAPAGRHRAPGRHRSRWRRSG